MVKEITDADEKTVIARKILEALPEWFGIEQARENYIKESAGQVFFAFEDGDLYDGFLALRETGRDMVEIAVTGVLKGSQRKGIGKALFLAARQYAESAGYSFMQVKTVKEGLYREYDATNSFYRAMGFCEFEVLPGLWDEQNPCQIYVMALNAK